jgi:hypothetical protein
VEFKCYPSNNVVEGQSTTDLLKHLQHAYNDSFNMAYDATNYGIFPPILKDAGVNILNEMNVGPGVVWDVEMGARVGKPTDYIGQMYQVSPMGKDFYILGTTIKAIADEVSGAHTDVMLGGATEKDEKATKTTLRAQGAITRLESVNIRSEVESIKRLAFLIWAVAIEGLAAGEEYELGIETGRGEIQKLTLDGINGRFEFAIPHLEGLAARQAEAEKLLAFWQIVANEVFFSPQTKVGLGARYNYLKTLAENMEIQKVEELFPSMEAIGLEMAENMIKQQEMQKEMQKQAQTSEIMQMLSGGGQKVQR